MVVFTFSHKEVRKQQKQQLLCYQPNIPQVYYFLSKRSFQSFLTRNLLLLLFHLLSHRLHPFSTTGDDSENCLLWSEFH
jgi:hypothetical protein